MSRTKQKPRATTRRYASPYRPALDLQRVARAVLLQVEPLANDTYRVDGGADSYYVSLAPFFTCDCGDAIFRESICKHQIAALLHEGDEEAVAIVDELREAYRARRAARRTAATGEAAAEPAPDASAPVTATPDLPAPKPEASLPEPEMSEAAVCADANDQEPPTPEPAERIVLGRWWKK